MKALITLLYKYCYTLVFCNKRCNYYPEFLQWAGNRHNSSVQYSSPVWRVWAQNTSLGSDLCDLIHKTLDQIVPVEFLCRNRELKWNYCNWLLVVNQSKMSHFSQNGKICLSISESLCHRFVISWRRITWTSRWSPLKSWGTGWAACGGWALLRTTWPNICLTSTLWERKALRRSLSVFMMQSVRQACMPYECQTLL